MVKWSEQTSLLKPAGVDAVSAIWHDDSEDNVAKSVQDNCENCSPEEKCRWLVNMLFDLRDTVRLHFYVEENREYLDDSADQDVAIGSAGELAINDHVQSPEHQELLRELDEIAKCSEQLYHQRDLNGMIAYVQRAFSIFYEHLKSHELYDLETLF